MSGLRPTIAQVKTTSYRNLSDEFDYTRYISPQPATDEYTPRWRSGTAQQGSGHSWKIVVVFLHLPASTAKLVDLYVMVLASCR